MSQRDDDDTRQPADRDEIEQDPPGSDFADEHSSTTVADPRDGGPEGVREPESPKGSGGMDPPNTGD